MSKKIIHHYTSIENLALILKTGKLRFNRLDKVDDIEEIGIIDPRVYMKFFISCWTDDNNESIPLWKMYTPNMRGVRISMPEDMFQKKVIKAGKYKNAEVLHDLYSPFSFEELVNENYVIGNTPAYYQYNEVLDFYSKVEYLDFEKKEGKNSLFNNSLTSRSFDQPASYGFHKSSIWEFQKEVRFKLMVMPYTLQTIRPLSQIEHYSHQGVTLMKTVAPQNLKQSFDVEYIDIDLSDKAIENIIITLGPLCTTGDRIIVESLLKSFSKNATLKNSNLTGKIRK